MMALPPPHPDAHFLTMHRPMAIPEPAMILPFTVQAAEFLVLYLQEGGSGLDFTFPDKVFTPFLAIPVHLCADIIQRLGGA